MIKKLHHSAYRCRDSEETRKFYEDFLGLRLAGTLHITETKSSRKTSTLHTFYGLDDKSYLAFFEAPDMPFDFKTQSDFDLHIALEVEENVLEEMFAKGKTTASRLEVSLTTAWPIPSIFAIRMDTLSSSLLKCPGTMRPRTRPPIKPGRFSTRGRRINERERASEPAFILN